MATLYLVAVLIAWNLISCETYSFSRYNYPNPMTEPTQCGRETVRKSYVCDPELILGPRDQEASQLDVLIARIVDETSCPCSAFSCERHREGYKIGIALTDKMRLDNFVDSDDDDYFDGGDERTRKIQRNLHAAQLYANEIQRRWNNSTKLKFGYCDEDVVIFYSHEDNVLYTSTGRVARLKLTDSLVASIAHEARETGFRKSVFDGLWKVVNEYRSVFLGIHHLKRPKSSESRPRNAGGSLLDASCRLNFFFTASFVLASYAVRTSP